MTKEKAKKIFEQYNRIEDIVRCPNGRASVRDLLDSYAQAAVNLYGVISRVDFADLFNNQNSEQTNSEELYVLLLPRVFKGAWYGFYKEYIVHYSFFDDFDQVEYLLKHQAGKPRYVPDKNEFLKYTTEDYRDNEDLWNIRRFMFDTFGVSKDTIRTYQEVESFILYSDGISGLGPIFSQLNFERDYEKQAQALIDLVMQAKNNTRIWQNNGYTPTELREIFNKRDKNVVQFPTMINPKIGRNDPCPCGSGKKYKKCCALVDDVKTAQLSDAECRLFYETWYGLLGFVNEREHIIKAKIKAEYPNNVSDVLLHKVREVLWEKPELIDEYLREAELPLEKIKILKLWRTNHIKTNLLILEYQPDYAVALASNEQGEDRLYGIKGISNSISKVLRQKLPVQTKTVLLPFLGKIIYDSFIESMPIEFMEGAKATFRVMHDKAMEFGIRTSFD